MQAGRLDQLITITFADRLTSATGTTIEHQNAYPSPGSPNPSPVTAWANVRQQSAAEKQRNGITTSATTYAIRIRHREGITADCQVQYRGRTLRITGVIEGGMQNREWLDLYATEDA